MSIPPKPNYAPTNGSGWTTQPTPQAPPQRNSGATNGGAPRTVKNINRSRTVNRIKEKNGGFNIHVHEKDKGEDKGISFGKGPAGTSKGGVPGADFMSNEDIRAYCEYRRKKARDLATELAMDFDYLQAALATIPDVNGSRSGARGRARRVARPGKKAAAAAKNMQKYFAQIFGNFEREFDSALRQVGKGRIQERNKVSSKFTWR
ncbi:plasmid transfer protein TraA [Streptomyces cavernicola]|uniref:Plasmid transfer protein TraA n=1 Tax=Streptomyces cavernicola TaxID=3043613 RepID=A0ABT6SK47_9ACTN|nr:plasmid transfer protein TraA [Streptomyces sp. B-S-A6]MDI3408315.1 plasmid transfer protein TraA [Streptomyces sp. B-S-A6]